MEMNMKLISQTISVLLILLSAAHAAEPQDPDALYQKAAYLMNLGYGVEGYQLMKQAAEAGSTDAMCQMGRGQKKSLYMNNDESMVWYQKAQEKGAVCGYLLPLSSNPIATYINGDDAAGEEFVKKFTPLAEQGDLKAIKGLALYYGERREYEKEEKYLREAATIGDKHAMYWLGDGIRNGTYGFYFFDDNRQKDGLELIEKSAELGYYEAISDMMSYYADKGDTPGYYQWLEKSMDIGYAGAIDELASLYSGHTSAITEVATKIKNDYHIDKEKSYACFFILLNSFEKDNYFYKLVNSRFQRYKKDKVFSDSDINEGEKIGREWLRTHKFTIDVFLWGVTS
jgi:uncharacterized protein